MPCLLWIQSYWKSFRNGRSYWFKLCQIVNGRHLPVNGKSANKANDSKTAMMCFFWSISWVCYSICTCTHTQSSKHQCTENMKHWRHLCDSQEIENTCPSTRWFHQGLSWCPWSQNANATKTWVSQQWECAYGACADPIHHRNSLFLLFPLKSLEEQAAAAAGVSARHPPVFKIKHARQQSCGARWFSPTSVGLFGGLSHFSVPNRQSFKKLDVEEDGRRRQRRHWSGCRRRCRLQ